MCDMPYSISFQKDINQLRSIRIPPTANSAECGERGPAGSQEKEKLP